MPRLYAKQKVSFGKASQNELPRYEYHRTLRSAIALSLTSYSYQEVRGSKVYQWDNIAPEVAMVIIQEAKKNNIHIEKELKRTFESHEKYYRTILQIALDGLQNNTNYKIFYQRFSMHLSDNQSKSISLDLLDSLGIKCLTDLDNRFKKFLYSQNKLTKNHPELTTTDAYCSFEQFVTYLTSNPLFEKFVLDFSDRLLYEYNEKLKGRVKKASALINSTPEDFLNFLKNISFDIKWIGTKRQKIDENTLYVNIENNFLYYSVIGPSGDLIKDKIRLDSIGISVEDLNSEHNLRKYLPQILRLTSSRGHTGDMALNDTQCLQQKAKSFIEGDINHDLFLAHIPPVDLMQDEASKYILYQWIENDSNRERLQDFIINEAKVRYINELEAFKSDFIERYKKNTEIKSCTEKLCSSIKTIIHLVAILDEDEAANDLEINKQIDLLILALTDLKQIISNTRNPEFDVESNMQNIHTADDIFESIIKKLVFHGSSDKVITFMPDANDSSNKWQVNAVELIKAVINNCNSVNAKQTTGEKKYHLLTDADGKALFPKTVLIRALKTMISMHLKNEVHHFHAIRSYENDKLLTQTAPLGFRGGNISDSLDVSKSFAKNFTRTGEYSADSHLLVGQENNIKKHEVRSGAAATLISATGVDGTRSVTDKFDIAKQFGGTRDVKIMYILRGKKAFHSHAFIDPFGKNKLSEISYTHVKPEDYVMTVLYDRKNTILDIIPGNLNDEIRGVDAFCQQVLEACINFYNQKHNGNKNSKPIVKLPDHECQQSHATKHLIDTKPWMTLLKSHDPKHQPKPMTRQPEMQLCTVKIEKTTYVQKKKNCDSVFKKELQLKVVRMELDVNWQDSSFHHSDNTKINPGNVNKSHDAQPELHYTKHNVLSIKKFYLWNPQERLLHEQYNRILQSNFMQGDLYTQLEHARIAQVEWLTDVLVPTLNTAVLLHTAARLITDYRINIEDINSFANEICFKIMSSKTGSTVLERWTLISQKFHQNNNGGYFDECMENARIAMAQIYPEIDDDSLQFEKILTSFFIVEKNKLMKKLINEMISDVLNQQFDDVVQAYQFDKKAVFPICQTKDFVFLGPPSSGKSTIARSYVSSEDRNNYVSLATDDYRGIFLQSHDDFEAVETDQVFIRTQDSAYLISELVDARLATMLAQRPNLIVDGITFKPLHRKLVEQNKNSQIICACFNDISLAIQRAYARASDENMGSSDKGRHINPKQLIDMHVSGSMDLIRHCGSNTRIALYNTNTKLGASPPLIATIDTHSIKAITIEPSVGAIRYLCSYFNKARANASAQCDNHLFFSKLTKPCYQIDSLFKILDYGFRIVLKGDNNKACLIIRKDNNGLVCMEVKDPVQLRKQLDGAEKPLVQMLVIFAKFGNLKEVQTQCLVYTNNEALVNQILHANLNDNSSRLAC